MNDNHKTTIGLLQVFLLILIIINFVPATLFLAMSGRVIWNMFAGDIYPQITIAHAIGPILLCRFFLVYLNVDCQKPERDEIDKLCHRIGLLIRPYFCGGIVMGLSYLTSLFITI